MKYKEIAVHFQGIRFREGYEAPRGKAAVVSQDSMTHVVAVGMPCPNRSRAEGYND